CWLKKTGRKIGNTGEEKDQGQGKGWRENQGEGQGQSASENPDESKGGNLSACEGPSRPKAQSPKLNQRRKPSPKGGRCAGPRRPLPDAVSPPGEQKLALHHSG
ncbi:MAG: hypothetical protein KDI09_18720, partial [Halioglobus sp.]|nr:hypothetical protein [Halioglobus sp.]